MHIKEVIARLRRGGVLSWEDDSGAMNKWRFQIYCRERNNRADRGDTGVRKGRNKMTLRFVG